jgi:hypothetical protein
MQSKSDLEEAKKAIKTAVRLALEGLGFRRHGKRFVRLVDGVVQSAYLDRGSHGPTYFLEYDATLKKGESHIDLSVLHLPDITGQFEWEDQRLGDKNLMMADCPLDPDTRKAVLTERVTFSASKWFGQVSTEVQLEQRLVESHRTFDKRFIPLAKGLRKVGIEV